jgi:CspA family cold shock protein
LVSQIKDGDQVTFELKEGKKGMNAVNVKLA